MRTWLSVCHLAVLLCAANISSGFLLTSQLCVVPSPCRCEDHAIFCQDRSLKELPRFTRLNNTERDHYAYTYEVLTFLNFAGNYIKTINGQAFQNISSLGSYQIYIKLQDNDIHSIDLDAFEGIDDVITGIDLHNNYLTSLPSALGTLPNLQTLDILGNAIQSLDPSVMMKLGPSLQTFSLRMNHFQSWPNSLASLKNLQTLTLTHIPFSNLTAMTFAGMGSRLISLSLTYSNLRKIPSAVCRLQNLNEFIFDNNVNLSANISMSEPCHIASLQKLSLQSDKLSTFPEFFNFFPSVQHIIMDDNEITTINKDDIPMNNSVGLLSLSHNAISKTPQAISKMPNIHSLDLTYNNITRIEDKDFAALTNLKDLSLSNNPINHVDPNAFKNNQQMWVISMSEIKLNKIPIALTSMPALGVLYFYGNHVDCDCSLSYLKDWNVTQLDFPNDCNGEFEAKIKTYIQTDLVNCT